MGLIHYSWLPPYLRSLYAHIERTEPTWGFTIYQGEARAEKHRDHFVKLVEAWPEVDERFKGWMKCSLLLIWSLWPMMQTGDSLLLTQCMIPANEDVY